MRGPVRVVQAVDCLSGRSPLETPHGRVECGNRGDRLVRKAARGSGRRHGVASGPSAGIPGLKLARSVTLPGLFKVI